MLAAMIPSNASLVRYNNPVLLSRNVEKKSNKNRGGGAPGTRRFHGKQKLPPVQTEEQKCEEILNQILPPREWMDGGQMWIQQVSSTPATRQDIINLQEELDRRLQQRQAHETGICPNRRELYEQCFDELIRQETINCMERGLLLVRVHDEIKRTLTAYQTLYESTVAYGMRKALRAGQLGVEMTDTIDNLESEKTELTGLLEDLKARCESIVKKDKDERAADLKKRNQEMQFLRRANQQLKTQLEGILAPNKK